MSPNLRIAYRFLTAKKRAMLMSLSCTILGVGLFIVTQATTSGFEDFFVKTILGTDGAIQIRDRIQNTMRSTAATGGSNFLFLQRDTVKYIEGIDVPDELTAAVRNFANVRAVSTVLRGDVQVTSSFKTEQAQVFGIRLADHLLVSNLADQIVAGKLDAFEDSPSAAVIGRTL